MMRHVDLHYVYLLKDMIVKRSYTYFPNDKSLYLQKKKNRTYQKTVNILRPSNQHREIAELLSQSQKHLIFIIDGI